MCGPRLYTRASLWLHAHVHVWLLHHAILLCTILPAHHTLCTHCPHTGNGFFRVAHSVSFANTGSFAATSAANATTAEPGGAAAAGVNININSSQGSGAV